MASPIKTRAQRKAASGLKFLIAGKAGVGKTHLAKELSEAGRRVLFIDGEAGMLSLGDADIDSINIREFALEIGITPWQLIRHIAVLFAGANPSKQGDADLYGKAHYNEAVRVLGDPSNYADYDVLFFDSISEFSRESFLWASQQPEMITRSGAIDTRGVYGLAGREMVELMRNLQHIPGREVLMIGGLKEKESENGDSSFRLMMSGNSPANELPYIFDEVFTLVSYTEGETVKRAFVTDAANDHGYPAKDRSGALSPVEHGSLVDIINKIKSHTN